MCKTCWIGEGSPRELPPNADEIIEAIDHLYSLPKCGVGGPLHVELDDMNLDLGGRPWEPWQSDRYPFAPEAIEAAQRICDLMNPLPVPQRYAVMAKRSGWLD